MRNRGFSLVEIVLVIAILGILSLICLNSFASIRSSQMLDKDADTVVEMIRRSRTETLDSYNETVYGVHMAATSATAFAGSAYSFGASGNDVFPLSASESASENLVGGSYDVIFNRLTGETSASGTITISSAGVAQPKTITVYATGLVELK